MSRIATAVLASLLATAACGPAPAPPATEVAVYWEFERTTYIDGVVGFVSYDADVNWPPGTADRACPQSGVDYVTIADAYGNPLTGSVPCVNQAVQGALLLGFPGPNTYVVTGWRAGVAQPLYLGQVTIDVVGGVPTYGTAIAPGIPSDLTIDMVLADPASGPGGYATCGQAGVDQFKGWVEDGFGTLVWRNVIDCGPSFMPSIQYGPVDRDDLFIWIDTYDNRFVPAEIPWSKCDFAFPHLKTDFFSLPMDFGPACVPAPPTP
jgi:hypothetical protein